jgi:hypothetical protein
MGRKAGSLNKNKKGHLSSRNQTQHASSSLNSHITRGQKDDDDDNDLAYGDEYVGMLESKRTAEGTKENYKSKINQMVSFYESKFPDSVDDGSIIIPVETDAVLALFSECYQTSS